MRKLTHKDIKSARHYLEWSQDEFASRSGIAVSTIRRIETGSGISKSTLSKALKTFQKAGIFFLETGGFRVSQDFFQILEGEGCYLDLLDDIHETLKGQSEPALFVGVDEKKSSQAIIQKRKEMIKDGVQSKYLIEEGNSYILGDLKDYRWIGDDFLRMSDVTAIYGNKLAFVSNNNLKKIIVINDKDITESHRKTFDRVWETAQNPPYTTAKDTYSNN